MTPTRGMALDAVAGLCFWLAFGCTGSGAVQGIQLKTETRFEYEWRRYQDLPHFKSMAVAGEVADGVILADFVSADYVRAVRDQAGRDDLRITVFAELGVGEGEQLAGIRAGVGEWLGQVAGDPPISLRTASFWPELAASAQSHGWSAAVAAMPDDWWTTVSGVGTPSGVAGYVESLAEAGVDSVCFFPSPFDPLDDVAATAEALLPLVR